MNHSFLKVSLGALGLLAPLFSASVALADTTCKTSDGTVVSITDPSTCHFETSGGCTSQCTPVNFTTTCSAKCSASAETTCTNTCQTKCKTECTKAPDTFTCKDYCTTDCSAGCMASCTGDGCSAECSASCDTQCTERCVTHPGAVDCDTECKDSCTGSCTVEANIMCDVDCTTSLTGGCKTKCEQPSGGLFCDSQFIDIGAVTDCSFALNVDVTATGSLNTSCAAAPGTDSPFGVPAGLAAMAGLGLLIARRRRQS